MKKNNFTEDMQYVLDHPHATRHKETAFYYYDEPSHIDLFEQFAATHPNEVILCSIPEIPTSRYKVLQEIFTTLLEIMGDSNLRKREEQFYKAHRLARLRRSLGTRMLILTNIDRLVTPARKKPLLKDFHALVSYLKSDIMPDRTSVIMIGAAPTLKQLICQSAWLAGRFTYLPTYVRSLPRTNPNGDNSSTSKAKEKRPELSITLTRLLTGNDNASELEDKPGVFLTGEIIEAKKAQARGLIIITGYNGQKGPSETSSKNEPLRFCTYTLTSTGKELADKIKQGQIPVKEATDNLLIELINYAETNDLEPDNNRTEPQPVTRTHHLLAALLKDWVYRAAPRINAPKNQNLDVYQGDREFGWIVAEVVTRYTGSQLRLRLLKGWYKDYRFPYSVSLELEVRGDSRLTFKKLLDNYPGALSDLFRYGSIVRFTCNVPYDNEPKKQSATLEHMKAYFASDNDEEEVFNLSFEAYERTPAETITKATACLLSLHLSSSYVNPSSSLLQHHLSLQSRRRASS